ncbi:hypothetical protein [Nocardiopsis sp. MG754419]|uniref:DUF6891 domain-containing protein n=1 Tax=Nocardiopsis sp. MG754419 TaxID=2259865 RepID=UPI001BA7DE18|nr:hypothetical protein [Nocardiopsis sp. MG754419]MBR8742984.1 hypothetical protein [Nocardiopsis sp. MG754419]
MSDERVSGEDPHAALRKELDTRVTTGRREFREILTEVSDVLRENAGGDPRGEHPGMPVLRDMLDRAFARHLRWQRRWPARTEVDRLERAGQALAARGIPYFEALECCDGCLAEDGGDVHLWRLAVSQDPRARAILYCFDADIELAIAGEGLWLTFEPGHARLTHAVAKEILDVLQAHGLDAFWPEESVPRIRVDMEWRCRRLGRLAAHPGPDVDREPMVDVVLTSPVDHALTWWGEDRARRVPVREFTRLFLPWLPSLMSVTVTSLITGRSMTLDRDFDRIRVLGSGRRLDRRHLDEILGRWAVDGSLPSRDADPDPTGIVEVSHDDPHPLGTGARVSAIPLELAEARSLLYRTTPSVSAFLVFRARTGETLQLLWQEEHTLWMEGPDPRNRMSFGRFGAIAEAEDLVCRLALDGESDLPAFDGVRTIRWD